MSDELEKPAAKKKTSYVGVPAVFKLELACKHLNEAYDSFGCYLVGSALERPDWRDVDVVMIMDDEAFKREFPAAEIHSGAFELDTKWLIHTVALSDWLRSQTGLPIDFKIQPQTWANFRHKGPRHAKGIRLTKEPSE
ncbi:hypothetical protein [Mesorhizobium sp.]|uniref:hypothetical protein n=1 Tax=Mesorhizobium sp. TaxID=1871066 RepID=UPI00122AA495|nr:hypothetical protein [Mesorhizobium sp.]TIM07628.1 MAG: hypothetical protein E5Y62_18875 [Mesorhizobium sp.]